MQEFKLVMEKASGELEEILVPEGTTFEDIAKSYQEDYKNLIVLACVDGKLRELNKEIKKDSNVIFSTTNYHVFRAGSIANKQNINLEGIGSKTKIYFWINAFIREFIATMYSERKQHLFMILLFIIISIILIRIQFLANIL